jgi:hypothetical protein
MQPGYAYELCGSRWRQAGAALESDNDDWEIMVYAPAGTEEVVGSRHIDGALCRVFLCPDGLYRAQTAAACGGAG